MTISHPSHAQNAKQSIPDIAPVEAKILRARGGLANTFARLRGGKDVTIAYFGGSITSGSGASKEEFSYRALTTKWFRDTFPAAKITEVNAAIGGTGSDLGAFRFEQDVLQKKPDLIFIEFAVNDSGAASEQILRGMEGIVRQAWRANPDTDLCLIYTFQGGQQDDLAAGKFHRTTSIHDFLAEKYNLPAISVALPIAQRVAAGTMLISPAKDADGKVLPTPEGVELFANDAVHPRDVAMKIYADTISAAMPELEKSGKIGPHSLPTPLLSDNWENAKLVPLNAAMLSPGWQLLPIDAKGPRFAKNFPVMWQADKPGETLKFRFRGTTARLFDIVGPDGAQVWITVDGKKRTKPAPRFDSHARYHRLQTLTLADNLPDGEHTIEVEIDSAQPDRRSARKQEKEPDKVDPKKYDGTVLRVGWLMLIGDLIP